MRGKTSVIGAGQRFLGDIAGEGDLLIQGRLEGAIHIGGKLTVGPEALVLADVVAASVRIEGRLEGRVRSAGDVTLGSRGCLVGDVSGLLQVEEGGVFQGRIAHEREPTETQDRLQAAPHEDPAPAESEVEEEVPPVQAQEPEDEPETSASGSIRRLTEDDTIPPVVEDAPPENRNTPLMNIPTTRRQQTVTAQEPGPIPPAQVRRTSRRATGRQPAPKRPRSSGSSSNEDDLSDPWFEEQDYLLDSK